MSHLNLKSLKVIVCDFSPMPMFSIISSGPGCCHLNSVGRIIKWSDCNLSVAILILHQCGEPATSRVGRKIKWSAKSFSSFWSSISTEPGSSSPASGESGTGVAFKLKTALRLVLDPETEKMIQKLRKICLLEKLSQAQDSAQVSSQSSCWDKSLSWINQPLTETNFKV